MWKLLSIKTISFDNYLLPLQSLTERSETNPNRSQNAQYMFNMQM